MCNYPQNLNLSAIGLTKLNHLKALFIDVLSDLGRLKEWLFLFVRRYCYLAIIEGFVMSKNFNCSIVIPTKVGIHFLGIVEIPAFAGMTGRN